MPKKSGAKRSWRPGVNASHGTPRRKPKKKTKVTQEQIDAAQAEKERHDWVMGRGRTTKRPSGSHGEDLRGPEYRSSWDYYPKNSDTINK